MSLTSNSKNASIPSSSYATHFFEITLLVKSAATGGVTIKTELYLFKLFLVSSDNEPFPI